MSRQSLEIVTCERCGDQAQMTEHAPAKAAWACFGASRMNGAEWIGGDVGADLCPQCAFELDAWFHTLRGQD